MSSSSGLQAGVRPREVWAWAMYDFANSGYTTVVITAVFNAYFVAVVCEGQSWGTFAWTLALSISYALVIFSAPIIGAYADAHAATAQIAFDLVLAERRARRELVLSRHHTGVVADANDVRGLVGNRGPLALVGCLRLQARQLYRGSKNLLVKVFNAFKN